MSKKIKYHVRVSREVEPYPEPHEISAAAILAEYFRSDVSFVMRGSLRTADLFVMKTNKFWEIKSPVGNGKRTIQNNLRTASGQSENVVIDLRRCKIVTQNALARVKHSGEELRDIKRILVILKGDRVLDVKN